MIGRGKQSGEPSTTGLRWYETVFVGFCLMETWVLILQFKNLYLTDTKMVVSIQERAVSG